ncbi:forespore capture DNA-binding protein RefZ [Peribacillus psychrosaccharolyticus]|uniref:Forespore capture DNA-binding protein RefZ n=1 Tax=Peribacillus psychrosaccharolyticus TaxID=1407 RepID=A0A974NKV3_PERPY|nr:forespore capture DNA-binding protein RefZ [Peribacillus psychrosaccharolyticus]MEC2054735.1 forespore capture DNA-binding protein RefZ [Peribacillus psychrosaccharolyticus]MED3744038.1 forespore capture DNA-binding protein RefZ [Peribacillus psychrosaccharolyticus]QQS99534.1 forespore capture DNA-binding protein RefZ [Peribacillus psychrosaccharolyticus]
MNRQTKTKQAILDAALYLFHLKGFHATSLRDIGQKAQINPANIAYYFKNKNGLLEFCLTSYFEDYIDVLDRNVQVLDDKGPQECLMDLVRDILHFQAKNFLASSFIYGETALDSNLNREILSTYYMKENYYFQVVYEKGFKEKLFRHVSFPISMLQLKGQLSAPIIHARYSREVLHIFPQESYYIEKYIEDTIHFLHGTLFNNEPVRKLALS